MQDLFLLHDPTSGLEKRLAAWKALIKKRDEGKLKAIGVSNFVRSSSSLLHCFVLSSQGTVLMRAIWARRASSTSTSSRRPGSSCRMSTRCVGFPPCRSSFPPCSPLTRCPSRRTDRAPPLPAAEADRRVVQEGGHRRRRWVVAFSPLPPNSSRGSTDSATRAPTQPTAPSSAAKNSTTQPWSSFPKSTTSTSRAS